MVKVWSREFFFFFFNLEYFVTVLAYNGWTNALISLNLNRDKCHF